MSTLELIALLFFAPVAMIFFAFLLTQNRKKFPRTFSTFTGLFLLGLGAFALFYTYTLFAKDQAILPLKMAAPFSSTDHPILFVACTILDTGLGLAFLVFGLRTLLGYSLKSKSC
ncbi:MAG: hypothetical protein WA955_13310 [Diaphorobacter nitroreducens]|uniref:hypothetical protein n=1 Tax=Diaphorobacter TaxID=238749 RepID=UPI0011CDCAB3|nr:MULTISPECIES: hypothetical protein [unclassified Diaphorobacter]WKK90207.1 hypothetical protein QY917_03385 [Diaphorobacter sp. C33]